MRSHLISLPSGLNLPLDSSGKKQRVKDPGPLFFQNGASLNFNKFA